MKAKSITGILLLSFAVFSLIILVKNELFSNTEESVNQMTETESASGESGFQTGGSEVEDKIIVYYFHGDFRCPTCEALEVYADEAITSGFQEELNSGILDWQRVNYDKVWNEHFWDDYNLEFQSLILVEVRDGEEKGYKNLKEIWELVSDKPVYVEFVQQEVGQALKGL